MTKRAIFSVYNKTGLLEFAQQLANSGWELVASGGTARTLRQANIPVLDVADITHAPEMLGGRVKTLHPAVHGGILARDTPQDTADLAAQNIQMIDLVVCNLYPFQETVIKPGVTLEEAVEQIDIGGVTLLRAAAKNFARVTVVCDPGDYPTVLAGLQAGTLDESKRRDLALRAFAHTRDYDTAITAYLEAVVNNEQLAVNSGELPERLHLHLHQVQSMRYGENPHQSAALYATDPAAGPMGGTLLQGKPLSYNNMLDLDSAWNAAVAYAETAVVIVKHLNPCGIAIAETPAAAFTLALASDPLSAFGGVMAVNRVVDMAFVEALNAAKLFIEAVIAPGFAPGVTEWFAAKKKECRLVGIEPTKTADLLPGLHVDIRAVRGGVLVQQIDQGDPLETTWKVVSQRQPNAAEMAAMQFGWVAAQHVKSNAIVFAVQNATVGIGGGLSSRVDAVKLAAAKAGERAVGAIMASDAFFPFPDGVEEAARAGITAVVQPGGSVRDQEVIETADKLGLAMVFTNVRHFRH